MKIPFTKAHGARNDFLLTWRDQLPQDVDFPAVARAICERHTGAGADGWLLISADDAGNSQTDADADASIALWNSDGSTSEMSGNGTRCAAAFLVDTGRVDTGRVDTGRVDTGRVESGRVESERSATHVRIATGAGLKHLQLLERHGRVFLFEMNMGRPMVEELKAALQIGDAVLTPTILNVGNPQCAVVVENFDFDWRHLGSEISRHPRFPRGTNVSFVLVKDQHTIDVRFVERGAGETMSSGTGSTGAAAAAVALGLAHSPVQVLTPAGPLDLRWEDGEIFLAGPAEIVATGDYYFNG